MGRFSATVVDHFSSPRNLGRVPDPDAQAFVGSPVCGDQILLTASFDGDLVSQVSFEARGCAPSLAVGSLLTTILPGLDVDGCESLTTAEVVRLLDGLAPEQRHVADLGAEVAHRLAHSRRTGTLDEESVVCG